MSKRNQVFKLINGNSNDMLSLMDEGSKKEFFSLLALSDIKLRKNIGLSKNDTFGIEIEFQDANLNNLGKSIRENKLFKSWDFRNDISLFNGFELASSICTNDEVFWNDLDKMCSILQDNAKIGIDCGGHVHVGSHVIGGARESWSNFLLLWSIYENIIYRFTYNDYLTPRSNILKYASPMAEVFHDLLLSINDENNDLMKLIVNSTPKKSSAIYFGNLVDFDKVLDMNTIEFRCPNGTLEAAIWQNNINFFIKLLKRCRANEIDSEFVLYRYENFKKHSSIREYNSIQYDQALELCDIVFDSNIDKVYFLRQYFKDFTVGEECMQKSKRFVKKINK